ncbi:MAG: DUF4426 domain-containing protein [Gammaproteobacteria bacterium]|nr:DUF4426 domain-containing protein [Gammaproteobacteria bacterium]MDH3560253.1 DUF4426 domain-containing protein [Gammaproteobacteria bacterium]
MSLKKICMPWLLGLMLAVISPLGQAENSKDFGEYVVHYNALSTDMLPPQVAREYRITRSKNRGMINITVLRKVLGSPGQPVHAHTQVSAMNLAGQGRTIHMREVREGNAIYYIGEFRVTNEETLKFDVRVRPQGTQEYLQAEFSQDFYTQ